MGQDTQIGQRTEIEFLNGFVVRQKVGLSYTTDAVLTEIVKRVDSQDCNLASRLAGPTVRAFRNKRKPASRGLRLRQQRAVVELQARGRLMAKRVNCLPMSGNE